MDFNTTIDIILKDLKDIREIIEDLRTYQGVPILQIELARSKCKSAEEIIALLKTIQPEVKEPDRPVTQVTPVTEVKEAPPKQKVVEQLMDIEEDHETEVPEEIAPEVKIQEVIETPSAVLQSDNEVKQSGIIADKFGSHPETIIEKFEGIGKEDGISSILRSKPIMNLGEAIGLNDKFLFIRELFNGDQASYEQAIGKLNSAENYPDAKAIIMSYKGDNEENEVVKLLLDIVKRKLPSDG